MQRTAVDKTTLEIIELLSNSASYEGHPAVEVIETHISYVFLAGSHVYKLKKPVKFDFLDFSSIALRKRACQDELRLNRRMAPSVYHEVIPIRRHSNGGLTLGGSEKHEVVDWVVHMRRLDDRRTLASRIRDASSMELAAEIQQVAKFLAKFYNTRPPAMVRTDAFRRNLREHIEENEADLIEISPPEDRDQIRLIHSSQLRFLLTQQNLLDSRVLDGRIVDGHGDLRPDHIYIYKSPLVIDCIEFNPAYRTNDVIDELAFLAMSCDRLGQPQIGKTLFAEYAKAGQDVCDPRLIDFYKSYRACVRAKVAGLRGQQQQVDEFDVSLQKEHAYLNLAAEYTKSFDTPFVLIVGGLMGSGKSTLACDLASKLSAELVSADDVRRLYSPDRVSNNNRNPFGKGNYTRKQRLENYERMIHVAEGLVARNRGLIFDATFTMGESREMVMEFARRISALALQIECVCPRDETLMRIAERARQGNSASEALPEHYDLQVAEAEPWREDLPGLRVDTTLGLAEERSVVLEWLLPKLRQ